MLDGKLQFGQPKTFTVPQGKHKLNLKVWNQATPPALFIEGATIHTDSTWLATYEDKIWIDENGVAHGSGIYVPAASWNFDDIDTPPSQYRLERSEQRSVCRHAMTTNGILYDFGKETFGYLKVKGLKGCIHIYYGESAEEAMDKEHCETLDILTGGQSPCEVLLFQRPDMLAQLLLGHFFFSGALGKAAFSRNTFSVSVMAGSSLFRYFNQASSLIML
jgi:hypothetical protein